MVHTRRRYFLGIRANASSHVFPQRDPFRTFGCGIILACPADGQRDNAADKHAGQMVANRLVDQHRRRPGDIRVAKQWVYPQTSDVNTRFRYTPEIECVPDWMRQS